MGPSSCCLHHLWITIQCPVQMLRQPDSGMAFREQVVTYNTAAASSPERFIASHTHCDRRQRGWTQHATFQPKALYALTSPRPNAKSYSLYTTPCYCTRRATPRSSCWLCAAAGCGHQWCHTTSAACTLKTVETQCTATFQMPARKHSVHGYTGAAAIPLPLHACSAMCPQHCTATHWCCPSPSFH